MANGSEMVRSAMVDKVLALAFLEQQESLRQTEAWADYLCMKFDYRVEASRAEQPRITPTWFEKKHSPTGHRQAWDTDAYRAQASAFYKALVNVVDADPTSPDKAERKRADKCIAPGLWSAWRMERMARRYPCIRHALDQMFGGALQTHTHYVTAEEREYRDPPLMTEAVLERRERRWRREHFPLMTDATRETHAQTHPVYGRLSRQAEREGKAAASLSKYGTRRPKNGRSALGEAPLVDYRYPRRKAIRAWCRMLELMATDQHFLVYGEKKREINTAKDRERRYKRRVKKAVLRAAADLNDLESLAAFEAMLSQAKAALAASR